MLLFATRTRVASTACVFDNELAKLEARASDGTRTDSARLLEPRTARAGAQGAVVARFKHNNASNRITRVPLLPYLGFFLQYLQLALRHVPVAQLRVS